MRKREFLEKYWGIIIILILTPLLLYAVLPILPTHDDWAGTTKPDFNPFFIKERFLFYGYHWRPFDTFIGYIVGRNPQLLYPTFNHCVVVIGHTICACFLYKFLSTLKFKTPAKNITTLLFFISPATMATVSAIDSMNQVYALLCGISSFLVYIKVKHGRYVVWILTIFIATWWKENGLMWALICPILAYGFDLIRPKRFKRDMIIGVSVMIAYALTIFLLPKDIIIHPEYEPGILKVVKNSIKFLFTTFITVDYIYLLHHPSRNLLAAAATFMLTLPFMYYVFVRNIMLFIHKKMICTMICMLIAVGPHLGTIFSMMHTYAGLAMLSVMIAYSINSYGHHIKPIVFSLILYCLSAIIINYHLIQSSIESGLIGKQMAKEAVQKTGEPIKKAYVIIIEDDYPKLSSFCVIPNEAFGWGLATRYETNYAWPESIEDTTIERSSEALKIAREIGQNKLADHSADGIWIVDHQEIDVIKK